MSRRAVVIGGGLAGLTAALDLADAGRRVTLLERRRRLGGLTASFEHAGRWVDNGQHVFLRCCDAYLAFLARIGSAGDVVLQDRLDVTVIRPGAGPDGGPLVGRLVRSPLPAPAHLARSLATYPHLSLGDRLRIGLAALPLRRLDLDDPALDRETFGHWLARHGQRPAAVEALWDLITVATINLPAAEASLAMGAKVFQTGLLRDAAAADIGWAGVPLADLHGRRGGEAARRAGVDIRTATLATALETEPDGTWSVRTAAAAGGGGDTIGADEVVVALPHDTATALVPPGAIPDGVADLGYSAIVDVHVVFDRPVTALPLAAGVGTSVQWVFDRTVSSGLGPGGAGPQYLVASLSAADALVGERPEAIVERTVAGLRAMFPVAAAAGVVDTLVTKERTATFRAVPGSGGRRPRARSAHPGLTLAGAWTDTGWPATMEGAVRSGHAAAAALVADAARPARVGVRATPAAITEEVR